MEVEFPVHRPTCCNRRSVEYLIANDRVGGISGLADAIDFALSEYPWPTESYIDAMDVTQIAETFPSMIVSIEPHPDGTPRKFEAAHKFWDEGGPAPTLMFRRLDANKATRFTSIAPLFPLLLTEQLDRTYTVYMHHFGEFGDNRRYIGITKQGWPARWKQHLCAANNGSPYLFHQAIRKRESTDPESHVVIADLSLDAKYGLRPW